MNNQLNRRVIVIDDNPAIHDDFRMILGERTRSDALDAVEALFLDLPKSTEPAAPEFQLDVAPQGEDGYRKVQESVKGDRRYAVAFVDMRMPPGWDGMQTIEKLWQIDPEVQIVICTAYSDYAWSDIMKRFGIVDRLFILKKPFDPMEAFQLACALTEKWNLARHAHLKRSQLQDIVEEQAAVLKAEVAERWGLERAAQSSENVRSQTAGLDNHTKRPPVVRVIDDDPEMRKSLARLLDTAALRVEGYASFKEYDEQGDRETPGCLILDLHLAGENGINVMERMSARPEFHLPVIVLTGHGSVETATRCMKLGAFDYFEKPMKSDQLVARIRGAIAIDIRRCQELDSIEVARRRIRSLSPREREMVDLVSRGLSSKQIAMKLGISIKTVVNRRAKAMAKVSASNSSELVRIVTHARVAAVN